MADTLTPLPLTFKPFSPIAQISLYTAASFRIISATRVVGILIQLSYEAKYCTSYTDSAARVEHNERS